MHVSAVFPLAGLISAGLKFCIHLFLWKFLANLDSNLNNMNNRYTVHGELHISLFEVLDASGVVTRSALLKPNSFSAEVNPQNRDLFVLKQFISNQEEPSMTKYNRKRN